MRMTTKNPGEKTFLSLLNAGNGVIKEPLEFDSSAHNMTACEFRQKVKNAFPMLPGIFGSGIGLRLQREDSDIAERIMMNFVERDIPILTIHDSFIVTEQHRDELVGIMQSVFLDTYGQTPTVSVIPPLK